MEMTIWCWYLLIIYLQVYLETQIVHNELQARSRRGEFVFIEAESLSVGTSSFGVSSRQLPIYPYICKEELTVVNLELALLRT